MIPPSGVVPLESVRAIPVGISPVDVLGDVEALQALPEGALECEARGLIPHLRPLPLLRRNMPQRRLRYQSTNQPINQRRRSPDDPVLNDNSFET